MRILQVYIYVILKKIFLIFFKTNDSRSADSH